MAGRRPGNSGTREAIAAAARELFAEHGYDRATMRAIAAQAGVDAALVSHFFGSKQRLFVAVTDLPFDPSAVLAHVLDGDPDQIGRRLAETVLAQLSDPRASARLVGMIRAAASEPEAARMVRERITAELLEPVAERLGADDPHLRAALASSQLVGLVMARHVVGLEPLAAAAPEVLAEAIGPVLQHYLGPVGGTT